MPKLDDVLTQVERSLSCLDAAQYRIKPRAKIGKDTVLDVFKGDKLLGVYRIGIRDDGLIHAGSIQGPEDKALMDEWHWLAFELVLTDLTRHFGKPPWKPETGIDGILANNTGTIILQPGYYPPGDPRIDAIRLLAPDFGKLNRMTTHNQDPSAPPKPRPERENRGPTARTEIRASVFRNLKEKYPHWSQAKVAMEAVEELGEDVTADTVRNTYRAMGWAWERADRVRIKDMKKLR